MLKGNSRTYKRLKLCNNMDSVLAPAHNGLHEFRFTFDHTTGWLSGPQRHERSMAFLHHVGNTSHPCPICPSIVIDSQLGGGQPESRKPADVSRLKHEKLYFLSLHYQGNSKGYIAYDVCRILISSVGVDQIVSPLVRSKCTTLLNENGNRPQQWPCLNHITEGDQTMNSSYAYCF